MLLSGAGDANVTPQLSKLAGTAEFMLAELARELALHVPASS